MPAAPFRAFASSAWHPRPSRVTHPVADGRRILAQNLRVDVRGAVDNERL